MKSNSTISILISGDVVPKPSNEHLFISGDVDALVGKNIQQLFSDSDFSSINLECALTITDSPILKCGPNLKSHPEAIKGIKALNPSLIGLANNHILDFGEEGLNDTLRTLVEHDLPYIGVGKNLREASFSLHVVEKGGLRVGFYACAEHEFTIATNTPGANPFDALFTGDIISDLKKTNTLDYLIILYHGGKEYYQYPSPELQRVCRHMVDKGADLIVCQHSHCIGSYEEYKESTIVYGQGNFIFDMKHPLSKEGLLITYEIGKDIKPVVTYHPIRRTDDGRGILLVEGKEGKAILDEFEERSQAIKQPGFIEEEYARFAARMLPGYLFLASPFGKWVSRIDRHLFKGRIIKKLYNQRKLLALQNMIECEAHRELVTYGLQTFKNLDS